MWLKILSLHQGTRGRKRGKGGDSRESEKEEEKKLTFPLKASAVSGVDSDTSEHFGPGSYLPPVG